MEIKVTLPDGVVSEIKEVVDAVNSEKYQKYTIEDFIRLSVLVYLSEVNMEKVRDANSKISS